MDALSARQVRIKQLEWEEECADREFERTLRTIFIARDRRQRWADFAHGALGFVLVVIICAGVWYGLARLAMWAEHWR